MRCLVILVFICIWYLIVGLKGNRLIIFYYFAKKPIQLTLKLGALYEEPTAYIHGISSDFNAKRSAISATACCILLHASHRLSAIYFRGPTS